MLLVIDIGNTNTVIGVYEGDELRHHWRVQTDRRSTADEQGILLRQLFGSTGAEPSAVSGAIISCVVPPMERNVVEMVRNYFGQEPAVVGESIQADMTVHYEDRRAVGADRLVNGVAAWARYKTSLVVVDFGTATTFDAIDHEGAYLGGAISPGITISSEALFHAASKLPRVEVSKPPSVIGRRTVDAIQSGLLYGYTGLVKEIVNRMKAELEGDTKVIATGGLARFIASETDVIDEVDPLLTLEGLRLIWEGANGD